MDVSKELMAAAETSRARHKVYAAEGRDTVQLHGDLLHLLFPDLDLKRGDEAFTKINPERVAMLNYITGKLARYAISLDNGTPHLDSLHDLAIYAIMLERLERDGK